QYDPLLCTMYSLTRAIHSDNLYLFRPLILFRLVHIKKMLLYCLLRYEIIRLYISDANRIKYAPYFSIIMIQLVLYNRKNGSFINSSQRVNPVFKNRNHCIVISSLAEEITIYFLIDKRRVTRCNCVYIRFLVKHSRFHSGKRAHIRIPVTDNRYLQERVGR